MTLINTAEHLVYDMSDEKIDHPYSQVHWLAWEDGVNVKDMKRIVWDVKDQAWYQWNTTTNDWVINNGIKIKWNSNSQHFE